MKKWMSVIFSMAMVLICSIAMLKPVRAETRPTVSIPVKVDLTGTMPEQAEFYTIKLEGKNENCPMPDGGMGGVYEMSVEGGKTSWIPAMAYDTVGIYTYTIFQEAGSDPKCTYDSRRYILAVYVTNAEDKSGLEITAALRQEGHEPKLTEVEFENCYETKPTPPQKPSPTPVPMQPSTNVVKTGDENRLLFYKLLCMVSGMGAVCVIYKKRKMNG